jgi:hypothetical protein
MDKEHTGVRFGPLKRGTVAILVVDEHIQAVIVATVAFLPGVQCAPDRNNRTRARHGPFILERALRQEPMIGGSPSQGLAVTRADQLPASLPSPRTSTRLMNAARTDALDHGTSSGAFRRQRQTYEHTDWRCNCRIEGHQVAIKRAMHAPTSKKTFSNETTVAPSRHVA